MEMKDGNLFFLAKYREVKVRNGNEKEVKFGELVQDDHQTVVYPGIIGDGEKCIMYGDAEDLDKKLVLMDKEYVFECSEIVDGTRYKAKVEKIWPSSHKDLVKITHLRDVLGADFDGKHNLETNPNRPVIYFNKDFTGNDDPSLAPFAGGSLMGFLERKGCVIL